MKKFNLKSNTEKPTRFILNKPKRFVLQVTGKPVTEKLVSLPERPLIISPDKAKRVVGLLDNAICYTSGVGIPTLADFNDVSYRLSDSARAFYQKLIEERDSRLFRVELTRHFAVFHLRSVIKNGSGRHYIIFEDRHGKTHCEQPEKTTKNKNLSTDGGKPKRKSRKKS